MRLTLDLHLHSQASPDGRMTVEEIAAAARARGLHGVAVCDHDVVYTRAHGGGRRSADSGGGVLHGAWPPSGPVCPPAHGLYHLGGDHPGRPPAGGLTVLAHPFQHRKEEGKLVPLVPYLDGMETWNGRANRKIPRPTPRPRPFAKDYGLIPTAGSDAHLAQEIGNGTITVEAADRTLPAIRTALLDGKGWITGEEGPSLCVARSQYTKLKKTHAPLCAMEGGRRSP